MFGSWDKYKEGKEDKGVLKGMLLNPKFKSGRTLRSLSDGVGKTTYETVKLLESLGARPVTLKGKKQGFTLRPKKKKRE